MSERNQSKKSFIQSRIIEMLDRIDGRYMYGLEIHDAINFGFRKDYIKKFGNNKNFILAFIYLKKCNFGDLYFVFNSLKKIRQIETAWENEIDTTNPRVVLNPHKTEYDYESIGARRLYYKLGDGETGTPTIDFCYNLSGLRSGGFAF